MSRRPRIVLLAFLALLFGESARAELPSLADGESAGKRMTEDRRWLDEWREGRVQLGFGALDYRFAASGFEAQWRIAQTSARAVVTYTGERRLEAGWRTQVGTVRLARTTEARRGGYWLELVRDF